MLEEDPNDVFVLYAIALELYKLGRAVEAHEKMVRLIAAQPDYVPAYFRLGQWHAEQDEIEEANLILNQALEKAKAQKDTKAIQEIKELLLFIEDYEN